MKGRDVSRVRVLIPLILTDGKHKSEIIVNKNGFTVKYLNHTYRVTSTESKVKVALLSTITSNRNAKYRIGYIEAEDKIIKYRLSIDEE